MGSGAPTAIYEPHEARPKVERSKDDNKDYVMDGSGEYIEETHQHFVILLAEDGSMETALIAMKSTQLKKSRKWNSIMASRSMMGSKGPFTPPRFALHFAMIFLGVILAIHFDFWIGFAIATTFTIKWFFMFPQVEGRR